MNLSKYIKTIRPRQWLKNVLIFFPAFFSLSLLNITTFIQLLVISFGFSLIASAIYIFNDLTDISSDIKHPLKTNKPITSGVINKNNGAILAILLIILGVILVTWMYTYGIYFCLLYILINVLYSLWIKQIPILDIIIVSIGFLIRIYLGGYAMNIEISSWLTSLIFLMAIYILIAKRKDDVLTYKMTKHEARKNIHFYKNVNFPIVLHSLSFIIIVIYSFYTFSEVTRNLFDTDFLWITIPFAAIGLIAFTNNINKVSSHFEPISLILKNKLIVISLLIWVSIFGWLIYV